MELPYRLMNSKIFYILSFPKLTNYTQYYGQSGISIQNRRSLQQCFDRGNSASSPVGLQQHGEMS